MFLVFSVAVSGRGKPNLLDELFSREQESLAKHQVKHGPTIGDMYEGLTQKGLRQNLPAAFKVVSGFARTADGTISNQIDCMVVVGEGEPVPNTHRWIYPVDRVIAVVEETRVGQTR
jgi:hypothetical protein